MNNRFVVILIACAIAFGGFFWFTKHKKTTTTNTTSTAQPTNHLYATVSGKQVTDQKELEQLTKSRVVLVEYGDFQCPACGQYYPLVKQVKEKYGDKMVFQFRNFPLSQIHQNAMAAHRAAAAASNQGKFWEMHNALYESQKSWESSSSPSTYFEGLAQQLGLDMTKYKQDAASAAVNDIINADVAAGQKLGADSTPTFVINGKKIDESPRDVEGFGKLIEAAASNKTN